MQVLKAVRLDKYKNTYYYKLAAPSVWHELEGDLYCVTLYCQLDDADLYPAGDADVTSDLTALAVEAAEKLAGHRDAWLSSHALPSTIRGVTYIEAEFLTEDPQQAARLAALAPIQAPADGCGCGGGGACGC